MITIETKEEYDAALASISRLWDKRGDCYCQSQSDEIDSEIDELMEAVASYTGDEVVIL